ncbi:MAG: histidine phosphatase family protein [Tenuifilum sp.]|jgi:phosphohistidine phosphatase|uniref:SixA phosphatase family protein n=1 Tax=Tenuifilum TaxID=2760873 RepID=UPI001B76CCD9|nr:histidine phosphatase family protein [Bacteroidales bacterium]HOK61205.1 histidine phosphatase family protein [Tenuifilum sp.]MBP9030420.1 histidine phosphatase family protein [Bacteroidales bacterium]HOK86786.1 histidine phosphatase family protein [Tenuifilum sp.]HON70320.1 histidine phosphatase family protein [Tenuifilum sp.]
MAKTLLILRHAKSSWAEADKADKDRALKAKGISDIVNTARAIAPKVQGLDLIITSSANRAVHTAILFAETIGFPHDKIRIEPMVYQADERELVEMIKSLPDEYKSVMVVGHNPTLTYLVNTFVANRIHELPTSGLVGVKFDINSWIELSAEKVYSVFQSFDW